MLPGRRTTVTSPASSSSSTGSSGSLGRGKLSLGNAENRGSTSSISGVPSFVQKRITSSSYVASQFGQCFIGSNFPEDDSNSWNSNTDRPSIASHEQIPGLKYLTACCTLLFIVWRASCYNSNLSMMRYEYRLKVILPALLAVLSLLALTAPTCLCAHHEVKAVPMSCHDSPHQTASTPEGVAADSDCICIFAERPNAADKSTPERITKEPAALAETFPSLVGPTSEKQISSALVSALELDPDLPDPPRIHSRGPPPQGS